MNSLKIKKVLLLITLYVVVVLGFLAVLILFSESSIYDKENLGKDIIKACIMGLGIFVYDLIKFLKKSWNRQNSNKTS